MNDEGEECSAQRRAFQIGVVCVPHGQLNDEWAWRLLEIINAGWMSQVVRVAAELSLPDLLADGQRFLELLRL